MFPKRLQNAKHFKNASWTRNVLQTLKKRYNCKCLILCFPKHFGNTFETRWKHIWNTYPYPSWGTKPSILHMDLLNFAGGLFWRTKMCDTYPPAERGFNFQKMPFFRLSLKPEVKCVLTHFKPFRSWQYLFHTKFVHGCICLSMIDFWITSLATSKFLNVYRVACFLKFWNF